VIAAKKAAIIKSRRFMAPPLRAGRLPLRPYACPEASASPGYVVERSRQRVSLAPGLRSRSAERASELGEDRQVGV
jgi:hypothetical protein